MIASPPRPFEFLPRGAVRRGTFRVALGWRGRTFLIDYLPRTGPHRTAPHRTGRAARSGHMS